MMKVPKDCSIRKLDKDNYVVVETGEIKQFNHIDTRDQCSRSVKATISKIRSYVNTNVTDPKKVLWITLTYAENMTDTDRLYADYKKFWQKFLRYAKKKGFDHPEYISVIEPQARGAWHVHAFFIWDHKAPYIPNKDLADLWEQGFTKTKAIINCDNVGAYFSAYLADLPLEEISATKLDPNFKIVDKNLTDDQGLTKKKKFIKGGRLYLYPAGMNILRYSKGIKMPIVERYDYIQAQKKVHSLKQTFSRTIEVLDDSDQIINVIRKDYYNLLHTDNYTTD